ncbi:conserved hypothetical protein [Candidatus Methylobacter favarea]|uniref:YecA family protein n=1 Tax=Candidatus Methylobacter favarea TaxID=2707345 RepID=A0A8S0WGV5_9GAMM|nr:UPF0149 family protein [Candidatus Methylobacter favarea]CAA9889399.1 conserved hypothetical protein [Candidatus Methylobacter favarea]
MAYQVINALFKKSNAEISAAEAHGVATGILCVNAYADSARWLAELFSNGAPVINEEQGLLIRLFEETRRLLDSEEFEFDLFLPEDEVSLSGQIIALKDWCQGFLFGVGSVYTATEWPGDSAEIMKDIAEFTKLDVEAEGEEDESAFMEVTEYLRSAVLLLREDLSDNPGSTVH